MFWILMYRLFWLENTLVITHWLTSSFKQKVHGFIVLHLYGWDEIEGWSVRLPGLDPRQAASYSQAFLAGGQAGARCLVANTPPDADLLQLTYNERGCVWSHYGRMLRPRVVLRWVTFMSLNHIERLTVSVQQIGDLILHSLTWWFCKLWNLLRSFVCNPSEQLLIINSFILVNLFNIRLWIAAPNMSHCKATDTLKGLT